MRSNSAPAEPGRECSLCERLVVFRQTNRSNEPGWHNAPVASFGSRAGKALIVGLAPGLKGANRTGRPFTGDYAGDLLYATLLDVGLAEGRYGADPNDTLQLINCRITNAVRCVPPQNKPTPAEIRTCRGFLEATLAEMPNLCAILALGRIAHDSVLAATGARRAAYPFAHAARHLLTEKITLFDSYHCSRYNTNTGVLTPEMFQGVLRDLASHIGKPSS